MEKVLVQSDRIDGWISQPFREWKKEEEEEGDDFTRYRGETESRLSRGKGQVPYGRRVTELGKGQDKETS